MKKPHLSGKSNNLLLPEKSPNDKFGLKTRSMITNTGFNEFRLRMIHNCTFARPKLKLHEWSYRSKS